MTIAMERAEELSARVQADGKVTDAVVARLEAISNAVGRSNLLEIRLANGELSEREERELDQALTRALRIRRGTPPPPPLPDQPPAGPRTLH